MSLVGLVAYHATAWGSFVDYVCTARKYRRRGIARRLMASLEAPVFLVTGNLTPSFWAYLKMGFTMGPGPYDTVAGEVSMCATAIGTTTDTSADKSFPSEVSYADLPCDDVLALLRGCGLSKRGVENVLRPADPNVRYRLVYSTEYDRDSVLPRKKRKLREWIDTPSCPNAVCSASEVCV